MSSIDVVAPAFPSRETPDRSALLQWMIFTGLCVFAVVLFWRLRLDPPDGDLGPHLHFEPDRRPLRRHVLPLLLADARDRAGSRGGKALPRDPVGSRRRHGARCDQATLPAGLVADHIRSLVDQGRSAGRRSHRPDAAVALARRSPARLQRLRRICLRHADEARPARHDHRLHHHAGADRRRSMRPTRSR